jgi:single-stranded-DNA-specific exonuclease
MTNERIWRLPPPSPGVSRLALETGISPLNAQILLNRGISDPDSAASFLSPRLSNLADPMLLKDMDRAVDLILEAMGNHEQIAVFGDYDADGITATALLINFFSELGVPISHYIPNRLEEGYSLNAQAIKKLSESGVRLMITVDCGISNRREIEIAKRLGMKLVVTDHHQIPEDFDPVCPVINPNRYDSLLPFRELSGVGVAFFLAVALRSGLRNSGWFTENRPEPDLKQYLDIVALGTVADMVPLIDQNRILVRSGIEVMKKSVWPGIKAMKEISGIGGHRISFYDLAFKLAPRLNAPGRLGDSATGLMTLTSAIESIAMENAGRLNSMNAHRQRIEEEILNEIEDSMIRGFDLKDRRTIVLAKEGWHQGVLGVVASRLLDRYYRPTLVLTIRQGMATGSGRSIDGFDLHRSMTRLNHLFEKFGGHYHAAGCTLKASNIEALAEGLEEIAREELKEEDLVPAIDIDAEISLAELTYDTVSNIRSMEPFGPGNPEPLFYCGNLEVVNSRVVGERHLKLRVRQGGSVMEAIGFGLSDIHPLEGKAVNMVFTPDINEWNGYQTIQLKITALEPSGKTTKLVRIK